MAKSTISMAIFHSYVSLPEGNPIEGGRFRQARVPGSKGDRKTRKLPESGASGLAGSKSVKIQNHYPLVI
jgi:hypothetical protein